MGVIVRCPSCDRAMLRVASAPGWLRIDDASGISLLVIPDGALTSEPRRPR